MSTNAPAVVWDEGAYAYQRKLGNFVQYFQVSLPTNAHGIPLKLIDPTVLMPYMLDCETTDDVPEDVLENATLTVDIEDAMPMIDNLPIWERLDGEKVEYYKYFKEYRESLYITGSRAISKIALQQNIVPKVLSTLAKVFHWQLRCKAYDQYKRYEGERKRMYEIEKLESKHSRAADTLLELSMGYMENHAEQLNPKIALQMLQTAVKMGRLSLGLNGDKPGSGEGGTSININQSSSGSLGEMSASVEVTQDGGSQGQGGEDMSQLQSILHILDKSGALDKVKVVDADYTVVEESE